MSTQLTNFDYGRHPHRCRLLCQRGDAGTLGPLGRFVWNVSICILTRCCVELVSYNCFFKSGIAIYLILQINIYLIMLVNCIF